ncbi:MAG: hypothetical protein ACKO5E_17195 [bacterium]
MALDGVAAGYALIPFRTGAVALPPAGQPNAGVLFRYTFHQLRQKETSCSILNLNKPVQTKQACPAARWARPEK